MNIDLTTILVDRGCHHWGRCAVEIYAHKVEIERGPPQWRGLIL
jgi:hypothetical protein